MDVQKYANLLNVKLFKPGTFKPISHKGKAFSFTQEDLQESIQSTNACMDALISGIKTGKYEGNDHIKGPVPSFINLAHSKLLPTKIKEWTKNVTMALKAAGEYIVGDFLNVDDELAEFLKARFPGRSIELIPKFVHPKTGEIHRNVIRSVGFLPPDLSPAVPGLNKGDWAVQFQESSEEDTGILTFYSLIEGEDVDEILTTNNEEVKTMADEKKVLTEEKKPMPQAPPSVEKEVKHPAGVSVAEFEALKAEREAEGKARKALEDRLILLEEDNRKKEQRLTDQEVQAYCDKKVAEGYNPAIFSDGFKKALAMANNSDVIEFSADASSTLRSFWQTQFETILKMAADGSIKVPMGENAADAQGKPIDESPASLKEAKIKEFVDQGLGRVEAIQKAMETSDLWE